jgi:hypothetical protein
MYASITSNALNQRRKDSGAVSSSFRHSVVPVLPTGFSRLEGASGLANLLKARWQHQLAAESFRVRLKRVGMLRFAPDWECTSLPQC